MRAGHFEFWYPSRHFFHIIINQRVFNQIIQIGLKNESQIHCTLYLSYGTQLVLFELYTKTFLEKCKKFPNSSFWRSSRALESKFTDKRDTT